MKKFLLLAALVLPGCSSATWSRSMPGRILSDYKVTLYSGDKAVGVWHTKGQVESEERSNGYYFVDRTTGHIVEIDGTVVIEQLP